MVDIQSITDVEQLVLEFYQRVNQDDLLAPAFNDVSVVDWNTHLPKMVSFWATLLFRTPDYEGDPYQTHARLGQKMNLTPAHFSHWVTLFHATVDDLFRGSRADFAKKSAYQMGRGMSQNLFGKSELFMPSL